MKEIDEEKNENPSSHHNKLERAKREFSILERE